MIKMSLRHAVLTTGLSTINEPNAIYFAVASARRNERSVVSLRVQKTISGIKIKQNNTVNSYGQIKPALYSNTICLSNLNSLLPSSKAMCQNMYVSYVIVYTHMYVSMI